MLNTVGAEPRLSMTAKCWSHFRNNISGENCETYYRRSISIPVLNDLIANLQDQNFDRNHTEALGLIPSIFVSPDFDNEQSSAKLY